MTGQELRQKYLDFFCDSTRKHRPIPSSSLLPEGDPTTLFTGSGMQPMMPYLLGQTHPLGVRLVDSQVCFRAEDLNEIGDNRHTTLFEMLGNWSLGDYFKEEQLTWIFEFLVNIVGLNPEKLYVTVFNGDPQNNISRDELSPKLWQKLFKQHNVNAEIVSLDTLENAAKVGLAGGRIFYYDSKKNWWARNGHTPTTMPTGEPGGPSSEIFFEFTDIPHDTKFGQKCHPNCDCGHFLEIGNSVFMEYQKNSDGSCTALPHKNVDFGGGLERILAAHNNNPDIFLTDLFLPIINQISQLTGKKYQGRDQTIMRIIADHLKASVFMIAAGLEPSNKQQGYVLRRLLRRSAVKVYQLTGEANFANNLTKLIQVVCDIYPNYLSGVYPSALATITTEMEKFAKVFTTGYRLIEKTPANKINGQFAFNLFQNFGFPFEVTQEIISGKPGYIPPKKIDFENEMVKHQNTSRSASAGMFKGGLADHSQVTTKYHTATHLLHQALRDILGDTVHQAGSNITADRLRFDFSYDKPLTPDQIDSIQNTINQKITENLPVSSTTMSFDEAIASGALAFFKQKYPNLVTVFSIGSYSKELCGGPHVTRTKEIGTIKVVRQESLGANTRRIYLQLTAPDGDKTPI